MNFLQNQPLQNESITFLRKKEKKNDTCLKSPNFCKIKQGNRNFLKHNFGNAGSLSRVKINLLSC